MYKTDINIDISLLEAVQKRKNSTGIKDAFKGKESESSIYMDMAIDEEAIDSLVEIGGNPSFQVKTDINLNIVDLTRTVIRRLYHGATGLDEEKLRDVHYNKERFYKSCTNVYMTGIAERRSKYYKTECDKLDFFVNHIPEIFTYEFSKDAYTYQVNNPKWEFKYVYFNSHISYEKWIEYEHMFGRYHRRKHVLINCIRYNNRHSTKVQRVSEKYPLRSCMNRSGMDVVRNIMSYI